MTEAESGEKGQGEKDVNWARKGRDINLEGIPVEKAQRAAERGLEITLDADKSTLKGKLVGHVDKTVVQGMPTVPKRPWWKFWGNG